MEIRILKPKKKRNEVYKNPIKKENINLEQRVYMKSQSRKRAYTLKRANKTKFSRVKDAMDKSKNGKKEKKEKELAKRPG